ncbi:EF-P lysine aminoacylase GenX [Moraxella nasovis]|uniref:EF-P lysine aminoacylase EpmA n=1 Tax=Moraxella nasovis TaxID=2904121 RepID=UPI001F6142D7|nr:EF-P lysine aminoacylase EpmA [Moraxella nasovis]UNU72781.1 EF-P lysine aminoacylase GenX [Moraxella nasovis]
MTKDTDFRPSMSLALAQKKAKMLHDIRQFFIKKDVLEITTPVLSHYGNTDVFIESISANFHHGGQLKTGYLHTSPEFAMKRVLADYGVPIFQICQVFRDNERSLRHNIEFTMLEWYRPNFCLSDLADELGELLSTVLGNSITVKSYSYKQVFLDTLGVHPFTADISTLRHTAQIHGINLDMGDDRQGWLDLLFSHFIEPNLGFDTPILITDYPPKTAALAKICHDDEGLPVAQRFELYINGLEIANAYDELADSQALLERFKADNAKRYALQLPIMPIDMNLVHACDHLPSCSGIALGIDRLFMVREQLSNIGEAITITTDNA